VSALATSLAIAVAMYTRLDRMEVYTGPGAVVGLASLQGRPTDARLLGFQMTAPYAGPFWFGRVSYRVSRRLRLALDIDAGLTTLPVLGTAWGDDPSAPLADAFVVDGLSLAGCAALVLAL
jgi:hypothetical protein